MGYVHFRKIVGLDPLTDNLELKYCPLANISICPDTKINEFNIIVYNPLAEKIRQHIQIPVDDGTWIVTDSEGSFGYNLRQYLYYTYFFNF